MLKPLLSPKNDFVFKKLFAYDTSVLLNLINAVLQSSGRGNIRSVKVKNPIVLPEELAQKFIIMDIQAEDERNNRYDIEMQVQKFSSYPSRALYYISKLYAGQMDAGDKYSSLTPAIGIHFLDYKMYSKHSEFQFCFEFKDCRYPELELTQDLALHLFELPKIKRIYVNRKGQADDMIQWLHFFNNAHKEDETMREHYTNPAIHKAFTFLEELSADEIERQRAEIREKALKDEATFLDDAKKEGFAEGIEQGIEQGADAKARSMVQILLEMKVASSEQIAEITGLSLEKIEAMQASLA